MITKDDFPAMFLHLWPTTFHLICMEVHLTSSLFLGRKKKPIKCVTPSQERKQYQLYM